MARRKAEPVGYYTGEIVMADASCGYCGGMGYVRRLGTVQASQDVLLPGDDAVRTIPASPVVEMCRCKRKRVWRSA